METLLAQIEMERLAALAVCFVLNLEVAILLGEDGNINRTISKCPNKNERKWPEGKYIAYLQANTNTYAPLDELKEKYEEIIKIDPNIIIFSIATRPDC